MVFVQVAEFGAVAGDGDGAAVIDDVAGWLGRCCCAAGWGAVGASLLLGSRGVGVGFST